MTKIDETLRKITTGTQRVNSPDSSSTKPVLDPLPGNPDCPICHGVGFYSYDVPVGHPEFGKAQICTCRQQEVSQKNHRKLYQFANLESMGGFTFDNFKPNGLSGALTDPQILSLQTAYNSSMEFSSTLNGWLLLMGQFGCGKTHLAAAIANRAVELGVPTLFLTVPDLLDWIRFSYNDSETTFEKRFEEIRNIQLLVMDDFGTENATPWAQEKLFQILNHRYQNRLPLVITTNQPMESIEARIQSRLQDPNLVQRIYINAPDYRNPSSAGDHPDLSSLNLHARQTFESISNRKEEGLSPAEVSSLENTIRAARRFAEQPQGWMMIVGDYGSGKTHIAAAIGNYRALKGYPPLLVSVPDLLDYLRASFHPESRQSYDRRFEEIRSSPLLILDDLGGQSTTPWAKEKLYQLFNYRYSAELPTVITSAQKLEEIDQRLRVRLLDTRICTIYGLLVPPFIGKNVQRPPARSLKSHK